MYYVGVILNLPWPLGLRRIILATFSPVWWQLSFQKENFLMFWVTKDFHFERKILFMFLFFSGVGSLFIILKFGFMMWKSEIIHKKKHPESVCCCRFLKVNCPLLGPGPTGGVPSVGVFLRDPSLYLRKFRWKPLKTPNYKVDKHDWRLNLEPPVYQLWVQNLSATGGAQPEIGDAFK